MAEFLDKSPRNHYNVKASLMNQYLRLAMSPLKILLFAAFSVLVVKLVTSLLGQNQVPFLNQIVTAILSVFIAFELFQLGQFFLEKFS